VTTCVIVASGPSFTPDQAAQIIAARERNAIRVIVVNNNWEYVPNADVLYAADGKWWKHYGARALREFKGECWTCHADTAREMGLCFIEVRSAPGLAPSGAEYIHSGANGGYQAMGLADRFGATTQLLVAYDMQHTNGKLHHHADHPAPMSNAAGVKAWVKNYDQLAVDLAARGVRVVNCSIETALTAFPRGDLATELEAI
jgi:hypothetical protein